MDKVTNHLVCAFLRRVLREMKRVGLNQTDLAKRMKVSRPYIPYVAEDIASWVLTLPTYYGLKIEDVKAGAQNSDS